MSTDIDKLKQISNDLRKMVFKMIYKAGGGHIAPSFSPIEIITSLYFGGVLKYNSQNPKWEERDRFILSKGHASAVLYAALAKAGYFEEEVLYSFCQKGSILGGHPNMLSTPGVEASTGALGHGLLYATGIALAGKLNERDYHTYVLLGDGECQEGSVWESALFAPQNNLGNLTAIIDYNKLQAMDKLENIIGMESFLEKWKAFGWNVCEVDGNNIEEILEILKNKPDIDGKPRMIIAHTVKGKGISFMEETPIWHCRLTNEEETKIAINELGITEQEWDV